MANIMVIPVLWSGFPGGPGTNTWHMNEGVADLANLHDFYGVCLGLIPSACKIQVPSSGAIVAEGSGEMVGEWSVGSTSQMTGSNTTAYASGTGATVRWGTGDIIGGRHVRGHTYMVPLYGGFFDTDGTIKASERTILSDAADDLITSYADSLVVWHRPKEGAGGSKHLVTSAVVPDRPAFLTSRRG